MKSLPISVCTALSVIIAGIFGITQSRPSAPAASPTFADQHPLFAPRYTEFIREGMKLKSLAQVGVRFESYGEQLASTRAAFEILDSDWPADHYEAARVEFIEAIRGWQLAYQVWRRWKEQDGPLRSTPDRALVATLDKYAPGKILHHGPGTWYGKLREENLSSEWIPLDINAGVLMGIASEHFTAAHTLMTDK